MICTNPPKEFQNTITRYAIQSECLVGQAVECKENYDLLSVVMVCLGEQKFAELTKRLVELNRTEEIIRATTEMRGC